MLPSRGLFKDEPCPLFEIKDCDRPHCHFRHKRLDTNHDFALLEEALDKLPIIWETSPDAIVSVKSEKEKNIEGNANSVKKVLVASKTESINSYSNSQSVKQSTISEESKSESEAQNLIESKNQVADVSYKPKNVTIPVVVLRENESVDKPCSDINNETPENVSSESKSIKESHTEKSETNSDNKDNVASSEKRLTKEHLRGIDEIVKLLKKVPERIDFVANFLKSFVKSEEKSKPSVPSSRRHSSTHSHSSRSHRNSSSKSSRSSDKRHRSDRHHKSSRSDKKDSSSHRSEKRKRDAPTNGDSSDIVSKKVSRRESTGDHSSKMVHFPSPKEELESDADNETNFVEEDVEDFRMEEDEGKDREEDISIEEKRLSIDEELEKIHEGTRECDKPAVSASSAALVKRRIAHDTAYISDHQMLRDKVGKSSLPRLSIKTSHLEESMPQPDPGRTTWLGLSANKTRISAVPYAQKILAAKSNLANNVCRLSTPVPTAAKSIAPGQKRMEHIPSNLDTTCPTVTCGSLKVASTIRNLTLKRLYTALHFLPTKSEARDEAINVENSIFEEHKDSSKKYHMASVNAIMKAKRGYSKEKPSGPSEAEFYDRVKGLLMTQEQLVQNGFPIEVEKGYAKCHLSQDFKYNRKYRYIKDAISKGERYCIRCSMTYKVDEETWEQTPIPDVCVFHSDNGKRRVMGEVMHKCCTLPGKGCMSESLHITDLKDYERLPGCVKSVNKFPPEKYRKVLALDCEMVHTRLGVELAYIVVVDSSCSVVYESYCKPSHAVECYNTAYSGITEEKLRNVTKTLSTVQRELLELISDETVLVGHSLDSDFRALHLIHETVADTSYIFRVESPDGSFYKKRLKELAQTFLGKIIQENDGGHCAEEDAAAAMALLRHRVFSM